MIETTTDVCKSMSDRSERSIYRSSSRCIIVINTMSIDKPYIIRRIDSGNTNLSRFAPGDCTCRISTQDVLSVQTNYTSRVIQRSDETSLYECGSCNTNRYGGIQNICNFKVNCGDCCGSTNDISNDTSSNLDISEISGLSVKCCDRSVCANLTGDNTSSNFGVQNISIININNCLLYTSPSPRDYAASRMPSSA